MEGGDIVHNKYNVKSVFVVFASCLFIFSPLLILFCPPFFPMTFFYERYTWVYYTPSINHLLFGIAIGLLFLACLVVLLIKKFKIMIPIASILTIGAIVLIVGSSVSYLKLTPDGVKVRYPFEKEENVYEWTNIEKVEYSPDYSGADRATYTFIFEDGTSFDAKEVGDMSFIHSKLKMQLWQYDIPYINTSSGHHIN